MAASTRIVCAKCGKALEPDDIEGGTWTDDKARAAIERDFPGLPPDKAELLCRDCYFDKMEE